MHPMERLRSVAGATGYPEDLIVDEAARALAAFIDDPQGLVTACRRLVSHRPTAPVVWMCARLLTANDVRAEVRLVLDELADDPTARSLAHALPDEAGVVVLGSPAISGAALVRRGDVLPFVIDIHGTSVPLERRLLERDMDFEQVTVEGLGAAVREADLVLLEASAVGPTELLAVAGSLAAASVARVSGKQVWAVAGAGRLLPRSMYEPVRDSAIGDEPWDADDEVVPLDLVDAIVGPSGAQSVSVALQRTDCPVVTGLFKGDVF